jgi:hypothetical protein
MGRLQRKGNGHRSIADIPFDGDSMTDIDRTVQAIDMPNAIREFVHIGKTYEDLLMRTVFRDDNQRNAVITFIHKCEKFGLQDKIDMMLNWLAASPSVGGRSRLELLQATTGIIATGLNPTARGWSRPSSQDNERAK